VGAEVEWWMTQPSGRCQSPVVGINAEPLALEPSDGHCSQVMGIRGKWWVLESNGGIRDKWWSGGDWRLVVGIRAHWQVCTRVEWWVCSQVVGCGIGQNVMYADVVSAKQCQISSGYTQKTVRHMDGFI